MKYIENNLILNTKISLNRYDMPLIQICEPGGTCASGKIDCLELRGRGGLVRIGIAPYNIKDELIKVIDALKQI